ncbi:MAG: hypothetical protein H6719_08240 [Sandaracinaceae bacterium]|nr:hypothetical protein [Sandaracinaceae bacterium]
MTYRSAPVQPLVVCMGRGLLALDPATGQILWSIDSKFTISRLFRVGERLLFIAGDNVHCIDLESGAAIGVVDVGFFPDEGIVCGTDLIVVNARLAASGRPSAVCLTSEGAIRWKGTSEMESTGLLSGHTVFRTTSADGAFVSEARYGLAGEAAGFLFGDQVVQPDKRG